MPALNPYLQFGGNAREAMETYRDIFGGTLDVNLFADFPMGDGPAPEGVMHAQLQTDDGITLMGSDSAPGQPVDPNGWVSISGHEDKLRDWFARLSEGGKVIMPLEKQMWGDEYGQCVDRFGISWMVNVSAPAAE